MPTRALIVAGGASRRMGRDKLALARDANGSQSILAHVAATCRLVTDDITVLCAPGADADYPAVSGVHWQPDAIWHEGPLSALAAGWPTDAANVLVVAGDLPGLHRVVLETLVSELGRAPGPVDGVAAEREGRLQPLVACYRPRVGAVLNAMREAGERRLMKAIAEITLKPLRVDTGDWPEWWTRPVHTPEDYELWLQTGGRDE